MTKKELTELITEQVCSELLEGNTFKRGDFVTTPDDNVEEVLGIKGSSVYTYQMGRNRPCHYTKLKLRSYKESTVLHEDSDPQKDLTKLLRGIENTYKTFKDSVISVIKGHDEIHKKYGKNYDISHWIATDDPETLVYMKFDASGYVHDIMQDGSNIISILDKFGMQPDVVKSSNSSFILVMTISSDFPLYAFNL